jgi:PAS domain-containing protein
VQYSLHTPRFFCAHGAYAQHPLRGQQYQEMKALMNDADELHVIRGHVHGDPLIFDMYASSMIEDVNVWLNVIDAQYNIIFWNAAAERMSGYTRAEVLGNGQIWELLYPDVS